MRKRVTVDSTFAIEGQMTIPYSKGTGPFWSPTIGKEGGKKGLKDYVIKWIGAAKQCCLES